MIVTDYTNLIEQLLNHSMDDAAIALQSQGKRIAELEAQLSSIHALLPDDLYSHSKDWVAGNLAERIEWLKIGYESQASLVRDFMAQIDDIWEQSPIGEVTHSDVLPGDDGLYRHEFRSSERIGLQAELFARPVKVDEAQSPVGYQELFNAISAATDTPYPGAVGVSVKAFTENIGPLYKRPVPSEYGKVTVTTDDHGRCVAVTRTDDDGRILSVIWEAGEMEKPVNVRLVESAKTALDALELNCKSQTESPATRAMESLRDAIAAAESQQAEPVLPANKTRGGSTAWLQWALHIIRNRCPDVLTSHQYDCAAKAMAAGFAAKPVRLTDKECAMTTTDYAHIRSDHMLGIARAIESAVLRANGFKVEG